MADSRRISEALGVDHIALVKEGAFDGYVAIDSRLYIDPFLLSRARQPELKSAAKRFSQHFSNLLTLVRAIHSTGDAAYRAALELLVFHELPALSLGYSVDHNAGSGIGLTLAARTLEIAREIVRAGVNEPDIFQLIGLFQEGVGADRVSDMTGSIIAAELVSFGERVGRRLRLETSDFRLQGRVYRLPADPVGKSPMVLVPSELLRALPVAESWSDIDIVCRENQELRRRLNGIIGSTWKKATTRVPKSVFRRTLLEHPEAILDLLRQYREKSAEPYDTELDPARELSWKGIGVRAARDAPFPQPLQILTRDLAGVKSVVLQIVDRFKLLIESNGLDAALRTASGAWVPERIAQLIFFAVADSYCEANNLDLNREPNAGRGPVDFKVSSGFQARVPVELKYSHNRKLAQGYEEQLPTYAKGERTTESVYLVIRTTKSETGINAIRAHQKRTRDSGGHAPEIVIADARPQPSASKRPRKG